MRRFHRYLLPDGALIMSLFLAWQAGRPLESDWALVFDKTRPDDGLTVRRWS
ncbi:MAG: hypothetical protein ACUVSX_16795 [Aggregatilineales bacterium]